MESTKHDTEATPKSVTAPPQTVSKKSGLIQAVSRSLAEPAPSIKAIDAMTSVLSPDPETRLSGSMRVAEPEKRSQAASMKEPHFDMIGYADIADVTPLRLARAQRIAQCMHKNNEVKIAIHGDQNGVMAMAYTSDADGIASFDAEIVLRAVDSSLQGKCESRSPDTTASERNPNAGHAENVREQSEITRASRRRLKSLRHLARRFKDGQLRARVEAELLDRRISAILECAHGTY